jgi:hypothetical protein
MVMEDPKDVSTSSKPPLHLNPPVGDVLQSYAHLNGAKKYGAFNWRECDGVSLMNYLGAMKRHIACIVDGQDTEVDPDTKIAVDHLGAIMATAAIIADARHHEKLTDDRPKAKK